MFLASFRIVRPSFEIDQDASLAWLARAHTRAEITRAQSRSRDTPPGIHASEGAPSELDVDAFERRMTKVIARVACSREKIATRGCAIGDCTHTRWDDMEIYDVRRSPQGAGTEARMAIYAREAESAFTRAYDGVEDPPGDLVHVTCTGYVAPSAAQRLVAARGWGSRTRVTHAYHMGCYAAIPALRIAAGFLSMAPSLSGERLVSSDSVGPRSDARRVDVVHTELCSLHFDPTEHTPEQLVVQSLFADGAIRYEIRDDDSRVSPGLELIAIHEAILPDTSDSMAWRLSGAGMRMTLARDVPDRIAGALVPFVRELFARGSIDFSSERGRALFAIHPGGPKIIDRVRVGLELGDAQVEASVSVLRAYGNMSSATLPHVWSRIAGDPAVASGTLVASLAFGPGLTMCGALFRKT